jgi:hypothetical protein
VEVEHQGERRDLVLHTATSNRFGHDRRADRAAEVLLAADTFGSIPQHVRAVDVGAFGKDGRFLSLRETGEFYLLTEWGEGAPYAEDLRRLAHTARLEPKDRARVDEMAQFLAALHGTGVGLPFARERSLRDLFGSGEGIFGIVDGYDANTPGAPRERIRRIEQLCHGWRWRLKDKERRLVRTHGDFHPFNVLFDGEGKLVLLDTSRGSNGEACDDVACMAINFPFFSLDRPDAWRTVFSRLWYRFFERYLSLTKDDGLFDVIAPFFAWRGLVLASPVWYPKLATSARSRLLDLVETVLVAERFSPDMVEGIFR